MRFGSRGLSEFVSRIRHRSSDVPYKRESPTLPDKTKFEPVLEGGIYPKPLITKNNNFPKFIFFSITARFLWHITIVLGMG